MPAVHDPAESELLALLGSAVPPPQHLQAALELIGAHFGAATGTVHALGPDGTLRLVASFGVPESLRPVIDAVPVGKGIAGEAARLRRPVTMCNIQSDASGIVRPRAKETGVEGAIAVPILEGDDLVGILGVGKACAHDFTDAEQELLARWGSLLVPDLRRAREASGATTVT